MRHNPAIALYLPDRPAAVVRHAKRNNRTQPSPAKAGAKRGLASRPNRAEAPWRQPRPGLAVSRPVRPCAGVQPVGGFWTGMLASLLPALVIACGVLAQQTLVLHGSIDATLRPYLEARAFTFGNLSLTAMSDPVRALPLFLTGLHGLGPGAALRAAEAGLIVAMAACVWMAFGKRFGLPVCLGLSAGLGLSIGLASDPSMAFGAGLVSLLILNTFGPEPKSMPAGDRLAGVGSGGCLWATFWLHPALFLSASLLVAANAFLGGDQRGRQYLSTLVTGGTLIVASCGFFPAGLARTRAAFEAFTGVPVVYEIACLGLFGFSAFLLVRAATLRSVRRKRGKLEPKGGSFTVRARDRHRHRRLAGLVFVAGLVSLLMIRGALPWLAFFGISLMIAVGLASGRAVLMAPMQGKRRAGLPIATGVLGVLVAGLAIQGVVNANPGDDRSAGTGPSLGLEARFRASQTAQALTRLAGDMQVQQIILNGGYSARGVPETAIVLARYDVRCFLTTARACALTGAEAAREAETVLVRRHRQPGSAPAQPVAPPAFLYADYQRTYSDRDIDIWVRR